MYVDGVNIAISDRQGGSGGRSVSINSDENQSSDWAVAEVITWNRKLSNLEILMASRYMQKRILGISAVKTPTLPSGFPAELAHWFPSALAHPAWEDVIGGRVASILQGDIGVSSYNGHGSDKEVRAIYGDVSSQYMFGAVLPREWTLCTVSRYTGSTRGRVIVGGPGHFFTVTTTVNAVSHFTINR